MDLTAVLKLFSGTAVCKVDPCIHSNFSMVLWQNVNRTKTVISRVSSLKERTDKSEVCFQQSVLNIQNKYVWISGDIYTYLTPVDTIC